MNKRLQRLGLGLVFIGIVFFAAGGYTLYKTQQGASALQAFSAAQNVRLTYNDQGQLADRKGDTTEATAIMSLLVNDWGFTVDQNELNPNDPLVNTASEYMYQMATITYHTITRPQTVVLPEDVTADSGKVFKAGSYDFNPNGKYWTGYDRSNPIEAIARDQAWSGTAHGLIAELGVGTVTHSALQLGLAIAAILGGIGGTIILAGLGLIWAARAKKEQFAGTVTTPTAEPVAV